jgi:hypothetical protein
MRITTIGRVHDSVCILNNSAGVIKVYEFEIFEKLKNVSFRCRKIYEVRWDVALK